MERNGQAFRRHYILIFAPHAEEWILLYSAEGLVGRGRRRSDEHGAGGFGIFQLFQLACPLVLHLELYAPRNGMARDDMA